MWGRENQRINHGFCTPLGLAAFPIISGKLRIEMDDSDGQNDVGYNFGTFAVS